MPDFRVWRDAFAMPELVEHGRTGRLTTAETPAELANVLGEALADDGLYLTTAEASPRAQAHYTWDRAASELVKIVSEAIAP